MRKLLFVLAVLGSLAGCASPGMNDPDMGHAPTNYNSWDTESTAP
jgi:hypothetical protein